MARKIKTTKTAEQRRAEADALHASITEQVEALRDSDAWQQFLEFAQSFHSYSLGNLMLIQAQMPEATQIAGFRKWQELGRQVRKGERAIKIFGYAERKAREGEDDGTLKKNAKGEAIVSYFPMLSVFDIDQTDATAAWTTPELTQSLTGKDDAGIYAAAADYISAQGWTVERESIAGATNGYTRMDGTRRIVVDAQLSDAQAAKTMLHETAHALMHESDEPGEYVEHRGLKECEAESVAYIVAGILGMDTSAYSVGYVAGWTNGDTETIRDTAAAVLRTAHKIADALTTEAATDSVAA